MIKKNNNNNKLEQTVREGAFGPKEIKKGEKNRYLGEFEERIIAYLNYNQVMDKAVYPEINQVLSLPEAEKLIIRGDIPKNKSEKYTEMARKNDVRFIRKSSPEFRGEVELAVAGKNAVNTKKGKIIGREEKLQKRGLSDNIIKNAGAVLCKSCWQELMKKSPEEKINYRKAGILDRLSGTGCIGCRK